MPLFLLRIRSFKLSIEMTEIIEPIATCSLNNIDIVRNPGRDISFPIFIRKEIETRKLERESKQQISR